jgi:CMP-N-acetylneuraminic acid synthetase
MAQRAPRRQDLGAAWIPNGAIYVMRRSVLFDPAEPSLYGRKVALYPMEARYSIDIDGPEDWAAAELAIAELTPE